MRFLALFFLFAIFNLQSITANGRVIDTVKINRMDALFSQLSGWVDDFIRIDASRNSANFHFTRYIVESEKKGKQLNGQLQFL